ncbi:MAG: 30S ribosomal protein S3 [Synechococcales cyanobacterium]
MGQKIHPNGLRLGIVKSHRSQWYADPSRYPALVKEDAYIRKYIDQQLNKPGSSASIAGVFIERKADQVAITINTARPGVVVGKGGEGLEKLRLGLQKELHARGGGDRMVRVNVTEVQRIDAEASLIAESIVQQLERRVAFRRAVRQVTQKAQRAQVQGIKIQIAGRLNGAEIARTEWSREGRIPLHTLRADIDYAEDTAHTTFGVLGVKVWVFKGEILPHQQRTDVPKPNPTGQRRPNRKRPIFEDRSSAEA